MADIVKTIEALKKGEFVTPKRLAEVLECQKEQQLEYLFTTADQVRKNHHGKVVKIRAIIEFSNHCRCSCWYCGMYAGQKGLQRYRMKAEELVSACQQVWQAGYQTVVLQSGEDLYYTKEMIGEIVKQVKTTTGLAITLSLGERPFEDYAYWKLQGADRYLIKHETCNEPMYNRYHPHSSFQERIRCQNDLRLLGYELGSGFMVGLPGQTNEMLAEDILFLKRQRVSMAGIGPYICHPNTRLRGSTDGSAELTLKALALARLALPRANLPSTTALNVKGGMRNALHLGANVIMQKATPFQYRNLYDIYPGRESAEISLKTQLNHLKEQLCGMGFTGV